ncbi:MAG TPA: transcription termination/antitermination NusG family protein, partial [Verrucomicrobiota bacterium]|nr:transcription termination/antitermination NusG family protein [Verrucomicrobiota bacterium]
MEALWYVAHVRARCEKKVAEYSAREGWEAVLPLYRSVKRYRGKTVEFRKPLFPGYVFVKLGPQSASKLRQHQLVANLLEPPD